MEIKKVIHAVMVESRYDSGKMLGGHYNENF